MAEQPPQQVHPRPRRVHTLESSPPFRGPRSSLPQQRRTRTRSNTTRSELDPHLMPADVPNPSHRHGTPSGPWPWLDLHTTIDPEEIFEPKFVPKQCAHRLCHDDEYCWCDYPQSLFRNWTPTQQEASRISEALSNRHDWHVYPLVVSKENKFNNLAYKSGRYDNPDDFWKTLNLLAESAKDCHLYALFIDYMTGPIMQMLGTKYNIEPFFFSSSFGWIPSRYQENRIPKKSDHITITLTFIHCLNDPENEPDDNDADDSEQNKNSQSQRNIAIRTNRYLNLSPSDDPDKTKILFSDMISLHMIRDPEGHALISYHAPRRFRATPARKLRDRFKLIGSAVYWSKIFARSRDPTFSFLSLLWYPLYAWDESFEALYNHICFLESSVLEGGDSDFTQELHNIRAHLLHYADLLEDFKQTVTFVRDTHYPALEDEEYFTPEERQESIDLMTHECKNLLNEIERLEMTRKMQDKRLTNVMQLGFSIVNIKDSGRMQNLTEAAVRDSAAMKQIAYLTMIFLPASFVATAFGMNVQEINGSSPSLGQYFAAALPLTAITVWIVGALQIQIKDSPSSRRSSRSPGQNRRPEGRRLVSHQNAPPGHEIRHAFTASSSGDIIITPTHGPDSDNSYDTDDNYNDKPGNTYYQFNPDHVYDTDRQHNSPPLSIWKRLWWPVSLTQYTFTHFQGKWRKDEGRHRRTANLKSANDQKSNLNGPSLPLHWIHNFRRKKSLTPAAEIVANVRSNSDSFTKSVKRNRSLVHSQSPSFQPQPILRREGEGRTTEIGSDFVGETLHPGIELEHRT